VVEGDSLSATAAPVSATEGTAFSGRVATFSDTFTGNTAADFTATIDWGDGTTTAGTVSGGSGSFTVSGSHAYADEGTFTVTAVLTDDAPGTASATGTAAVADADVLSGTPLPVQATEGTAFSGAVATFSDTFTGNVAADFTATIDWGDGTTTAGTVSGSGASFTVSGSHTYADEGTFPVTTVLTDDAPGTASATATGTAAVADADVLSGTPLPVQATEGTAFSGRVATFSDTFTGNVAADFTATIDWGDGTITAGTVSGGSGSFTISGSHTYADEGSFRVTVQVRDPGGTSTTASGTVAVLEELLFNGSRGTPRMRFISEVFRDVLGRPVDANNLKKLNTQLRHGLSRAQLVLRLLETRPFRGQFRAQLIRALFEAVRGVAPTSDQLSAGLRFLAHGGTFVELTRRLGGFSTPQARQMFVKVLYRQYLDRLPDPNGFQSYLRLLRNGVAENGIIAGIVGSPEFFQKTVP
jgi:hypothetical protein